MPLLNSSNFSGNNGSHFFLDLYYEIMETSTENNQTKVRYAMWLHSSDYYSAYGSPANGYILDEWVGSLSSIPSDGSVFVGYKYITYTHNENGNLRVSYSASFNTPWDIGNASVRGDLDLPKIDRYSIISEANNFNDEQNPSMTFSNNLLYDLRAKIYVGTTQIVSTDISSSATSYTFQLTTNQRNQLRELCTGKTLAVKLQIISIENNVEKYTSEKEITMSMINAEPTFTYTFEETNSKVISFLGSSSANNLIKNVSILKTTVVPTSYKYATITAVSFQQEGQATMIDSTSPYVFSSSITSKNFIISVVDSRGYTTSIADSSRTLLDYEPLKINSYSFKRQSSISSNVILNLDVLYYDTVGSISNTPVVKWCLDGGSYTTIPSTSYVIDSTNHKLKITNYTISNVLPYTNPGRFTIYIEDELTSVQDSGDNGLVLKGVATYDVGEHDMQINGDLYIADTDRDNEVNVLSEINKKLESYNLVTDGPEVKVGYKIDGKDVYAKRFYFPTLVNGTYDSHNLSNFTLIDWDGMTLYGGVWRKLNCPTANGGYYVIDVDSTYIYFYTSTALTGMSGEITLYYIYNS